MGSPRRGAGGTRRFFTRRPWGWLLLLAAVLGAAVVLTLRISDLRPGNSPTEQVAPLGRRPLGQVPATGHDQELVRFYSPVLRLSDDEPWVAVNAWTYAVRAEKADREGWASSGCLRPSRLMDVPPSAATAPCRELVGPTAGFSYRQVARRRGERSPAAVFRRGTIWPRIVDVRGGRSRCRPDRTCRVLDYWIFYADNVWTSSTSIGRITQSHAGDWEHVAVGIDADDQPRFVAYSAHCKGVVRPWEGAPTVAMTADDGAITTGEATHRPRSHPLVVVARGSHANYPTTGRHDPDWSSCAPSLDPAARTLRRVTLEAGAVETTPPSGPIQIPHVASLARAERVLNAPWWWGPDERFTVGGLEREVRSHGPASPALQRGYEHLWRTLTDGWECERPDGRSCRTS